MSSGCLDTILDEYLEHFERALAHLGDEPRLGFFACYDEHEEGERCWYCMRFFISYTVGRIDIMMRRWDGGVHCECSLPFAEACDIVALHTSGRTQLAFRKLQSNYLANIGADGATFLSR